jgi:uncharacterized protein
MPSHFSARLPHERTARDRHFGEYGPAGLSLARARELCIDAKRAIAEGRSPAGQSVPTSSEQLLAYTQENLMITEDYVRKIFKGLERGDGAGFFEHVDDKVDWIVEGTHPLAGHYKSKSDFLAGTFAKLGKVLPNGAQLVIEHLLVKDDQAVVELHSLATAKNGLKFDNKYCWVVHFDGDTIDRVRAYLDSAMVARLFEENPI